jgi:hypothetical protein
MTPHVEVPELTFHGLHYCDLCGEPLIPGETLCGLCRACRTAPPSRDRTPREPRRKRRRQDPRSRWN